MRSAIKAPIIGAVLWLAVGPLGHAQERSSTIKADGTTTVSARSRSGAVTLVIRTATVGTPSPGRAASSRSLAARWACTGGREPCLLTVAGSVTVNGKKAVLPNELLVDLGDPVSATIKPEGSRVIIDIKGGDASVAYYVRLTIAGGRLEGFDYFSALDDTRPIVSVRYFPPPVLN